MKNLFILLVIVLSLPDVLTIEAQQGTTSHQQHGAASESSTPIPSHTDHAGHGDSHADIVPTTLVNLLTPQSFAAQTSARLTFEVTNSQGKPIIAFDTFQEKLLHLIVVSEDLQVFMHLHPEYLGNGQFRVDAEFPFGGNYTLFCDYRPTGQPEQVAALAVAVTGTPAPQQEHTLQEWTKPIRDIRVNLLVSDLRLFDPPVIRVGEQTLIGFELLEQDKGQPITDLQPYLGERGHLVIVRQAVPLTRAEYIHAHARKDGPAGQVLFETSFPQPGLYKLWGQFQRQEHVLTADFWVNVQ